MTLQDDIQTAANFIREGKLAAFPTETVYGLGADAFNPDAVAKIFELKKRPAFDPLIVHIADTNDLKKLSAAPEERLYRIAENFWPGPLTVIVSKKEEVPGIVTAGLKTVAVRMPAHQTALDLIKTAGCPVAAPSANLFGRISPTKAEHVRKQLPGVDFILDGGRTTVGIESTIIHLTKKGFRILRNGIITKEEIEKIIPFDKSNVKKAASAPGMLNAHYSPVKKIRIADDRVLAETNKDRAALIAFSDTFHSHFHRVILMTQNKNLKEYAANMFEAMHILEEDREIETIIAEPVPEKGIGIAIMDKLRKAEYDWK